jgi:hypothetical protein
MTMATDANTGFLASDRKASLKSFNMRNHIAFLQAPKPQKCARHLQ